MPRYLALSNGRLLVNFDREYRLRDLYWPHVGQENHTEGDPFRFGVRCDDQFSWTGDCEWEKEIRYLDGTLVGENTLRHYDIRVWARRSCAGTRWIFTRMRMYGGSRMSRCRPVR